MELNKDIHIDPDKVETPEEKKARITAYRKAYYLANKAKIDAYQTKYRADHRPADKPPRVKSTLTPQQRMKAYREKMGSKYNEFRNELLTCPTCGVQHKRHKKWIHDKSAFHIKAVERNNTNPLTDKDIIEIKAKITNDKIKKLETVLSELKLSMK